MVRMHQNQEANAQGAGKLEGYIKCPSNTKWFYQSLSHLTNILSPSTVQNDETKAKWSIE